MAGPVDKCRICGWVTELTFEHVPPKAAFNDRGLLAMNLKHHFDEARETGRMGDPDAVRRMKLRRGAGAFTLCRNCNNDTGAWYGNAYVDWAMQGMAFRYAAPRGSSLLLPFHLFPGRVAKMILAMFASACGPGLFEKNHDLRRYVLNRDHVGLPPKFKLYTFLLSPQSWSSRQAGLTGLIVGAPSGKARSHTFAEISFPPFGYILTIESVPPDDGLSDITYFTGYSFRDYRDFHLRLPMRDVASYFPGDFRTHDQWREAIRRARAGEIDTG